jgi:hypothetical protein
MKVSHEVPLSMLKESLAFNDYDYALVHLFEECPEYFQFYKDSINNGRHVLLDNSLFELGTAFNEDEFAKWITKLKPTEYIIPDSMNDSIGTINNLHSWISKYNNLPGKKIGVVQGATFEDMVVCYRELDKFVDKIAISFGYSYFNLTPHPNKHVKMMLGRINLLGKLLENKVINVNKPHHLLGNSLPIEGKFYNQYNWIESVDSSSPIVHAIKKIKYEPNFGLYSKEPQKLNELINFPLEEIDLDLLNHNVREFKKYWNKNSFY